MKWLNPFLVIIAILGCTQVREDPDPPSPPHWVEKSPPEALVEAGIDAISSGSPAILLMWNANSEPDLAGYIIYRADTTASHPFQPIAEIDLIQTWESDTSFIDEMLHPYVDYYYYLTARDHAGNESAPSDTIQYRLMQACQPLSPVDQTLNVDALTFSWIDPLGAHTYTQEYVLRVEALAPEPHTVWLARFYQRWYTEQTTGDPIQFDWFSASEQWPDWVNVCLSLEDDLSPGLYRWKIKNISEVDNTTGLDECSGESEWVFFEITSP